MIDLRASTDFEVLRAAKVLARIDKAAREAGVEYLVVGATARSLISIGLRGATPARQTRDIDIAVEVESWDEYNLLVQKLQRRSRSVHKFTIEGTEVDVVPYGGIELEDRTIMWPDDHAMSVLGFREAVASAQPVFLPDGITVNVPSIPALVLLKLFAWRDRRHADTRDALDLAEMIPRYSSEKYFERLYDEEYDVLDRFDHDPPVAGAWLLGTHVASLLDDQGMAQLLRLVDDDELIGRLANDMGGPRPQPLIQALVRGVHDAAGEAERE